MRWLANYFRQVLCKHEFELTEGPCERLDESGEVSRVGIKVSPLCRRCGYHLSFWKFGP